MNLYSTRTKQKVAELNYSAGYIEAVIVDALCEATVLRVFFNRHPKINRKKQGRTVYMRTTKAVQNEFDEALAELLIAGFTTQHPFDLIDGGGEGDGVPVGKLSLAVEQKAPKKKPSDPKPNKKVTTQQVQHQKFLDSAGIIDTKQYQFDPQEPTK